MRKVSFRVVKSSMTNDFFRRVFVNATSLTYMSSKSSNLYVNAALGSVCTAQNRESTRRAARWARKIFV